MLEMARVLASRPPANVVFVGFGAEEVGLVGANSYVNALSADERNRIRLMINLDMVGVGDYLCISAASIAGEPDAELAFAIGQALEVPVQWLGVSGGSDHVPFGQAGIRSIMLHWEEDPNYHSPSDTADKVDPEKMALAGRIALELISELQP